MLTFGFNILAEHLFCAKNNQRLTFVFYTLVETNDISEPILWQFVCSQESRYANIFLLVRLVSVCHRPVFLWKQKWRQKSDWMEVLCLVYTFVFSPEPNRNSLTQDIFVIERFQKADGKEGSFTVNLFFCVWRGWSCVHFCTILTPFNIWMEICASQINIARGTTDPEIDSVTWD